MTRIDLNAAIKTAVFENSLPSGSAELAGFRLKTTESGKSPPNFPSGDEVSIFGAAYEWKISVLLKGLIGTGKTRFMEYMPYLLSREMAPEDRATLPGGLNPCRCNPSRPYPSPM